MSCCSKKPTPKKDLAFILFSFLVFLGMHAKFLLMFLLSFTSHRSKLFRFYLKFLRSSFTDVIKKNTYFNKYFYKLSVITFQSASAAIRAERLLLKHNLNSKIIPVPRQISATCTSALCIDTGASEKVLALLDKNKISYVSVRNIHES